MSSSGLGTDGISDWLSDWLPFSLFSVGKEIKQFLFEFVWWTFSLDSF